MRLLVVTPGVAPVGDAPINSAADVVGVHVVAVVGIRVVAAVYCVWCVVVEVVLMLRLAAMFTERSIPRHHHQHHRAHFALAVTNIVVKRLDPPSCEYAAEVT